MRGDRVGVNGDAGDGSRVPPRWSLLIVVPVILSAVLLLYFTGGLESSADPVASRSTLGVEQPPTAFSPVISATTPVNSDVPRCEGVTEGLVTAFLTATSDGDASSADALFATAGFVGYTEPPFRVREAARIRGTLLSYLDSRFADGLRLTFETQRYHGGTGDRLVGFGLTARNEDGDVVSGTGRVNCKTGKIELLVLSLPSFDSKPDGDDN
ncbi:MAG: hypothetical protein M5U23_11385 [Acidimicrobiia bacterium]|nr:hypothetical protein [Acidimicrobiia bacterium]